jgi:hypothetical protein
MKLPNDSARCHWIRTSYSNYLLPLQMCQGCERWLQTGNGGMRTPYEEPGVHVTFARGLMSCGIRIQVQETPA